MSMVVSALNVYPIKSLGGISVDSSELESKGLADDRRWMLVDWEGQFLTQRSDARLALFRLAYVDGGIRVVSPSGSDVFVPREAVGPRIAVTVWKSTLDAIEVSPEVSAWFSGELDQPCRLVAFASDQTRPTHRDYSAPGDEVSFADGFPVTIVSAKSLDDLNSRLDAPIPMNRFRPNIVIGGAAPFAEHEWPNVEIGSTRLKAAKTCGRCLVTTTDQETGERGVEPLRTLATYRQEGSAVIFSHNFIPTRLGKIAVGDELIVCD